MKFWLPFIKQRRVEYICFAFFMLLACVGFCTHEMWYDEAQAWQIARTAPINDILFLIPHYEGHPPFWHLLLAIPAKLGSPWQWSVGIIGFLFMIANGALIFFKAPFPRWVRCLLPFSYFLFYQYGIIVRPYSALTLVMLLLALYFPQKDKRSTLYVVLLAALCMCHIFGIAIAGGITLAWLWELKNHRPWKEYLSALCKDVRFHKMLGLLGFVIILFILMHQTNGFLSAYLAYTRSLFKQLLYVFFAMPADAVLTNSVDSIQIINHAFTWPNLLVACIVGACLWGMLFTFLSRKYILYLVLPYLCLAGILIHYCSRHHIGIALVLVIWYAWITLKAFPALNPVSEKIKRLAHGFLALVLIVPAGWSLYALYVDYKLLLFPGQPSVDFLNKYHLTHKLIFTSWNIKSSGQNIFVREVNSLPQATMLNVYMPYNMIANFRDGNSQAYNINSISTPQQTAQLLKQMRSKGLPDVLIGAVDLPLIYDDDPDVLKNYRAALVTFIYIPWKFDRPQSEELPIYLHQDLWNQLKQQMMADQTASQR